MSSAGLPLLVGTVQGVAFWLTVAMPLPYLLVLFVGPLGVADLTTLAALLAGNLLALVVGHGYAADG